MAGRGQQFLESEPVTITPKLMSISEPHAVQGIIETVNEITPATQAVSTGNPTQEEKEADIKSVNGIEPIPTYSRLAISAEEDKNEAQAREHAE